MPDADRRSGIVRIRVTSDERAKIDALAKEASTDRSGLIRKAIDAISRLEEESRMILDECREELQGIDNIDSPLSAVRWLRFAYVNSRMTAEELRAKASLLESEAAVVASIPTPPPKRRHLPDERTSRTAKITIADLDLYLTVGQYGDGTPGEIYVYGDGKWDPTARAMLGQWAIAVSLALQWGADGRNLFAKFARQRFEPAGPASLGLGMASSPLDAIARWILRAYYQEEAK